MRYARTSNVCEYFKACVCELLTAHWGEVWCGRRAGCPAGVVTRAALVAPASVPGLALVSSDACKMGSFCAQGRRVVRLKGGCPSVFARVGSELRALAAAGVPVELVPGVSSALAAPLLAGEQP